MKLGSDENIGPQSTAELIEGGKSTKKIVLQFGEVSDHTGWQNLAAFRRAQKWQ